MRIGLTLLAVDEDCDILLDRERIVADGLGQDTEVGCKDRDFDLVDNNSPGNMTLFERYMKRSLVTRFNHTT